MSIESSSLSLWLHIRCNAGLLFINYHMDGWPETHSLCGAAYWHFYGHDFVLLPFQFIFLRKYCLFMILQKAAKWWDPHNGSAWRGYNHHLFCFWHFKAYERFSLPLVLWGYILALARCAFYVTIYISNDTKNHRVNFTSLTWEMAFAGESVICTLI